jgi:16S rRNA (uracil1498-N3)-methyltransferase
MALPFFYKEVIDAAAAITLDEDTSKHIVQVLRMQNGEQIQLTNGRGHLFTCEIIDNNRKKCMVKTISAVHHSRHGHDIVIAISLVKNNARFEWFLEKATEIGVHTIIPLLCERTEKQNFKEDRLKNILISAMLQSQQCWLPLLIKPVKYTSFVTTHSIFTKFIAHCEEANGKTQLAAQKLTGDAAVLIGPEGDFTHNEIQLALQNNFLPVALGNTRLRTETAGIAAAVILANFK